MAFFLISTERASVFLAMGDSRCCVFFGVPGQSPRELSHQRGWGRRKASSDSNILGVWGWRKGQGQEQDWIINRPTSTFLPCLCTGPWGSFLPEVGSSRVVVSRAWAGAARAAWHACWPRLIWEVKASFTSSSPSKASGFCQTGNVWSPANQKL